MRRLSWLFAIVMFGCADVGPADESAALELVYDQQGTPAFAGQAIAIQSCGAGAFCHREEREGLDPADRFGAPLGLDFDLTISAVGADRGDDELERLRRHQRSILDNRGLVWSQVSGGHMPPSGEEGEAYLAEVERLGIRFERFSDDGVPTPLPGLDTEEGRELFRNWLASRTPAVERTEARGGVDAVVAPACNRECVEPTFESIYRVVVRPSCTSSRCHGIDGAEAGLALRFNEIPRMGEPTHEAELAAVAAQAWDRLVTDGTLSPTEQCGRSGLPMIEPNDAMRSIFYRKLLFASDDPSQCGSRMPLSGAPLNEQRLCAIRTWIDCGACAPGDNSCDSCIDAGRAACGVTADGQCVEQQPCPNGL